jgi:hypothetical protein
MAKLFLSELQEQLRIVKQKLGQIHIMRGPLAPPPDPKVMERREMLIKRKHDLEEKIMFFDAPPDPPATPKP